MPKKLVKEKKVAKSTTKKEGKEVKTPQAPIKEKEGKEHHYYYQQPMMYDKRYPTYEEGRMYYDGGRGGMNGRNDYREYPIELRDYREGRSPKSRRMYMESKEMHHDKTKQMQELEQYLKELGADIAEMIEDATPEEKTLLKTKLSNLATRIA